MTQKVDHVPEHEKIALQNHLSTASGEPTTDRASLTELTLAFEECHTVPTGYRPTKIIRMEST